jgi:hypothetical protein
MVPEETDGDALEAPVCHHAEAGQAIPLVWVQDGDAPSPEALRQSVVAHAGDGASAPLSIDARPGAFGARQRGWLTRLIWPSPKATALCVVVRSTFMDRSLLASWEAQMPEDALSVPLEAGGLVDGITPEGETAFYAVFEGPQPWRPLPLSPVLPPFDELRSPVLLGDVAGRLAALAVSLGSADLDTTATELLEAALRVLPGTAPQDGLER